MDTKENILDIALELFNRQGTAAVSTNHIAEELGISPGNLYYHFRNKGEIIRALFERLFDAWDLSFVLDETQLPNLGDLKKFARANFEILWAYRFAYRELVVLLQQDEALKKRWLEVRVRGFRGFRELFAQFAEAGVLPKSYSLKDVDETAEVCWLISEFWLSYLEVSGLDVSEHHLEHGVRLMLRVIPPAISPGSSS